jgi:hypothetical protein
MSTLETSTNGHAVPRFSIFEPFSINKVPTLLHCFIKRSEIEVSNPPSIIKADDGYVYTAVYDCQLPRAKKCRVIISFQRHTYGKFAIIRLADRRQK